MHFTELSDFRAELGLTQADFGKWLGERVGRSPYRADTMNRYENGRASVPWAIAAVIYKYKLETLHNTNEQE